MQAGNKRGKRGDGKGNGNSLCVIKSKDVQREEREKASKALTNKGPMDENKKTTEDRSIQTRVPGTYSWARRVSDVDPVTGH